MPINIRSEMHGACFRTAGSVVVNVEKDNEKKKKEQKK
jgi:hypothetical protein